MDRKIFICHVCDVETKRFADHLAAAHGKTDHKNEKVINICDHCSYVAFSLLLLLLL